MQASDGRFRRLNSVCSRSAGRHHRPVHAGFTLVELLVAMAVTLILIFALAQAFALVGNVVAEGRAAIEMAGSLRTVANRLQQDLDGLTVQARPWADEAGGAGYLEIIDGPSSDSDWNGDGDSDDDGTVDIVDASFDPAGINSTLGDLDDAVAFTSRSQGSPFVGERATLDALGNTTTVPIHSSLAEIVWWVQYEDLPDNATGNGVYDPGEPFTIYRRAMLIRPDLGIVWDKTGANAYANPGDLGQLRNDLVWFFNHNDLSVRINWWTSGGTLNVQLIANSLSDLTRRENRFAHLRVLSDRAASGPPLSLVPVAADAPWWALQGP
ncbi:MAG: prepilin-type N-terminal cleavage/methylation domain-containing protein, partial [Planctomycetes bacterium]|nr:prepilin-type N-terminal cleavage/methylation domain-containing protein [Planctomycetota bacterium]